MNINGHYTMRLNTNWQPIGVCSIKDAITAMNSSGDGGQSVAAVALNFEYPLDENGNWDFSQQPSIEPVNWEKWITLPIRNFDSCIHTPKLTIRVPTVIVSINYNKMPMKDHKPTKSAVRLRDNDVCQISGKKLDKKNGNIDHILPKSRGGKDTWENLIYIDKRLNSIKGNKTLKELGWKTIKTPVAPKPMPFSSLIKEAKHKEWELFLLK